MVYETADAFLREFGGDIYDAVSIENVANPIYNTASQVATALTGAIAAPIAAYAYNWWNKPANNSLSKSYSKAEKAKKYLQQAQALSKMPYRTRRRYRRSRRPYRRRRRYGMPMRSRKRKRYTKSKYTKKKVVVKSNAQLSALMAQMKRLVEADIGTLVYRWRKIDECNAATDGTNTCATRINGLTEIKQVLSGMRIFNPATPATPTVVNLDNVTQDFNAHFVSCKTKIEFQNATLLPAYITCYAVKVKRDTNITPVTAFTNGLSDIGAPPSQGPLVYPMDSDQFRSNYQIAKTYRFRMVPGQYKAFSFNIGPFVWNASTSDSHNLEAQVKYNTFFWMYRIEGITADGATSGVGTSTAKVNMKMDTTFVVKYAAGADLKWLIVDDDSNAVGTKSYIQAPAASTQNENLT
jgi:hypothetical protein